MQGNPGLCLVYLKGSYELIWSRMNNRSGHYMKPEMLKSQFEALEEPDYGLTVDAGLPVEEIIGRILGDEEGKCK
jgi:gluconate kinase